MLRKLAGSAGIQRVGRKAEDTESQRFPKLFKQIFEHLFRRIHELFSDTEMLGFLIGYGAYSFLRKFKHLRAGKSHKDRRMGGNDELRIMNSEL